MLPILMYHGLHPDPAARGRFDPVYSVRPADFARQLDWLLERGYRATRLDDLDPDTAGQVVITFDDGDVSNLEVALPLLRERGMCADVLITSGFLGQQGMLTAADVRALADAGMGIGSHGRSHAFLDDLDEVRVIGELRESRERLQELSGQRVDTIALPGGRGGARERRIAMELGYRYLLGSVPGANRRLPHGRWWQRIAVTRSLSLAQFSSLVAWRGAYPQLTRARHLALGLPKLVLGNDGYERVRARLL
ncbi:polysaccharide deacetylase family protein [Lysobacter sp. H21R4]|uniref:polysaccharide deacetylase family protein n=1 Tax=Lysobacter sp. H21R4 TaxID=2781021 RepID=UPI001888F60B|nr:polysaccharide deacetylase family protein [Lysobacter sp. H21R4]QOY61981.1 polysaccharide deacetylase family protein [Lysobacter sp. H21R4]